MNDIYEPLDTYFEKFPYSSKIEGQEERIAREAYRLLEEFGTHSWDFDVAEGFFGERGLSILIQNLELPWKKMIEWTKEMQKELIEGAALNFEVYDSIRDGMMHAGDQVYHHIVFHDRVLVEDSEVEKGENQPE
ncbi:hypothetical protein [Cerasicoccus frondis]|uniref:hypothetical protein n=1 Tax=Cerasicoccus frondis TaxID=490090 RepID=UPI0028527119|nr:hypothetical protein [Cerasicoccus frondis]